MLRPRGRTWAARPPTRRLLFVVSLLHVIQRYYPFVGGSELYFGVLSEFFAARGDNVTVYTTDAFDLEHFWAPGKRVIPADAPTARGGVTIRRFPARRPTLWRWGYPVTRRLMTHLSDLPIRGREQLLRASGRFSAWVPALDRALRHDGARYDLVHAANIALEGPVLAAEAYCRRHDVPFVLTPFIHLGEDSDRRIRKYYSMRHQLELARRADAVVAQTDRERRFLAAQGVRAERLHTIGAGVEPAGVLGGDAVAFRLRHQIVGPIVSTLGAAAYDKGTVHLVEAMRRLWREGSDATLVVAGPVLAHFNKFFTALPTRDRARCRLLGFISAGEKRDLLAATDVFALPSRTDSFGIVYLENWCYGTPVIGARAGGVPDVIDDGENGVLVTFGKVDELAGALRRLLGDREEARRLGAHGQAKVHERYTWDHVTAAFSRLYDDLLGRRRSA